MDDQNIMVETLENAKENLVTLEQNISLFEQKNQALQKMLESTNSRAELSAETLDD
jgi:hypothetical protein